jgi:uncharacterized protein (UPF0332 family)
VSEEREALVRYRMERARETLAEAELMAQAGHWNTCVNRLYYACFYAATALLLRHNLSASKHAGVRSLLNRYFVRTGAISSTLGMLYRDLFESRQQGDYQDLVRFAEQEVRPWIPAAQNFVACIEALLQPPVKEAEDA